MAAELARETARMAWLVKDEAPTLLVWGFEQHGKSSFIDSVIRFMYRENVNLVRRAGSRASDKYSVLHLVDESREFDKWHDFSKEVLFRLVDSPALAFEDESWKTKLSRVLKQGVWHKMKMGEEETDPNCKRRVRPECVVLVVSCMGCNMSELRALSTFIHETGTPFVVAVTNKGRTTESDYLERYLMQVANACRNESVFCLENYVQRPGRELEDVGCDEEAESAMSKLLIQAMEYIWEDRINDKLYSNVIEEEKDSGTDSLHAGANEDESFEFL